MASPTVSELLSLHNPATVADVLRAIKFDQIITGLVPQTVVLTGLTSAASHTMQDTDGNDLPGGILAVTDSSDTALTIILAGAVGAGECKVEYDSDGLATLTFNAAVTGFKVAMSHTLPVGLVSTLLAAEL